MSLGFNERGVSMRKIDCGDQGTVFVTPDGGSVIITPGGGGI